MSQVVTFSGGSTITYTYTHDGKKLRTVYVIGGVITTTDIIFNDPILSVMQADYDAAYRRLNDSLGEIDIKGKNLMEILQMFNERRDLIINQIGLSPKELLMNELMFNGGDFQIQSTHSFVLPEFRQGY